MKILGYITVTVAVMIYSAVLNGWVLVKLWDWFVVPAFDLPVLTLPLAIGIGYTVSHLTFSSSKSRDDKSWGEVVFEGFLMVSIKAILALAFGGLISSFV